MGKWQSTSQIIDVRALWCIAKDRLPSRYIFPTDVLWLWVLPTV
jgi:hypothetical protein